MQPFHLVLLPGLDGTGLLFQPLLEVLPVNIKPIIVSYPADEILGYDQLLHLIVMHLPKDVPFVLLGESFSGPLALKVAASKPKGLKGLILGASFIQCPFRYVPRFATALIQPCLINIFKISSKNKCL